MNKEQSPCDNCPRPCDSPYNEDGECLKAPPKELDPTAPTEKVVPTEDEE
jgi:hypothetical protein